MMQEVYIRTQDKVVCRINVSNYNKKRPMNYLVSFSVFYISTKKQFMQRALFDQMEFLGIFSTNQTRWTSFSESIDIRQLIVGEFITATIRYEKAMLGKKT